MSLLGSILGDIVGSRFEVNNYRNTDFEFLHKDCKFTDDTVLVIAGAAWMHTVKYLGYISQDHYITVLRKWCNLYPKANYGLDFRKWLINTQPYNSYGNGAAVRITPVGAIASNMKELKEFVYMATAVSHNHPEGIKGAHAIGMCIYLARKRASKNKIRKEIEKRFGYDLNFTCASIRDTYQLDLSCQGSVPQAIVAFLESDDVESAIRLAVSIGGDSDTIACMAGGIAEVFYRGVPNKFIDAILDRIPEEMHEVAEYYYYSAYCEDRELFQPTYRKLRPPQFTFIMNPKIKK